MENPTFNFHHRLLLLLLLTAAAGICRFSDASQRRVHIPDELDDVVDDEEDDEWREWGKPKKQPEFDPPPTDLGLHEMQDEMMKRQTGPVFGFVKLRLGTPRTPEMVSEMAMKWTKVARTGATEVKFTGVDLSTIMFTMQKGHDVLELREFLLSEPEAYEIKIGDQLFRRAGDPSFDEVFAKLRAKKSDGYDANYMVDEGHHEL